MALPQTGIFALGTVAHTYLEFTLDPSADAATAVRALALVSEPRTTIGGVNIVVGVRPQLWREVSPDQCPPDVADFADPVTGADGFSMPATQRDLVVWLAGGAYDVVFDAEIEVVAALSGRATLTSETAGWAYHRDLDLTGFIDGTENPSLAEAPSLVLVPNGTPGAAGSVLLLQKWAHDARQWTALPTTEQEQVMGRTKAGSVELRDKPATSHVARTDQDTFGHILRRNTAYGSPQEHGTVFVGFAAARTPLHAMLVSMAGAHGPRDALTRYTTPVSGAYYFVPALTDLARFGSAAS